MAKAIAITDAEPAQLAATVPVAVKTRTVARFASDPADPEKTVRLEDDHPEATYTWLFEALDGARAFISADRSPFLRPGALPEGEDENPGPVVGTLTKLDPRDGRIKWGPSPVRAKQKDSWPRDALVAALSVEGISP